MVIFVIWKVSNGKQYRIIQNLISVYSITWGYKSDAEKSENKIIGHLKNLYNHVYLVKGKFSLENNLWNTWKTDIYM